MILLLNFCRTWRDLINEACKELKAMYPEPMAHAIVASVPVPRTLPLLDARLDGYAMCLNHWLRFLPVPVILLNAGWFRDGERLRHSYERSVATGYHPDCGDPVKYVMAHELAHFIYVQMGRENRKKWDMQFKPGKPSGYSTTAEESFCEAFAGSIYGRDGYHF